MDLLKEAIAEAKAVRQIAEKNAISTLTEAFSPQMQSLLSRKIAEEEELEDEELDAPIAEEVPEEEETPPVAAEVPEEEPMEDEEDDLDMDEVLRELEGEDDMEEEPVMEEDDMESNSDIDDDTIDEILREVEDELAMEDEPEEDTNSEMATENKQLQRRLKEAHKVIATQKNILNEVGVLNAKLLYTTKILGKHDLTEAQKLKILEAFDRAKSLRETKLVYATIIESLKKTASKPSRRVTEGSSSKTIKSVAKPINESSFVNKDRWRLLAGIIEQ